MSLKMSTKLRDNLLVTGSLKSQLDGGSIKIFSGSAPADADAAQTGTLLCTITVASGSTGLSLASSAAGGAISKDTATWSGVNVATGTAGYWRWVMPGDIGDANSTTAVRVQGIASTTGSDLILSTVGLINGATQTIDYCTFALPA